MVKVGGPQHHSKQLRRNSDEDKSCATLLKEPKMIFLLQFLPRIGEESALVLLPWNEKLYTFIVLKDGCRWGGFFCQAIARWMTY